ncbi:glycosyltransferase [Devosia enhydra]|nr:glycosyltransferase [Devosia enhydra]
MGSAIANRPRILVLADQFTPSRLGGGPVTSLVNLVAALGDEFAFHVATLDRDLGEPAPYPGLPTDQWLDRGTHRVLYRPAARLWRIATPGDPQAIAPDLVYLNSVFSPATTLPYLLWRRLNRKAAPPAILAPRGGLADAALAIKAWKKRPVLGLMQSLGAYQGLHWQATAAGERDQIVRHAAPPEDVLHLAPNLAASAQVDVLHRQRAAGAPLRIAFLGRIVPMKNLDYALRLLAQAAVSATFDIHGPSEDRAYEAECRRLAETLPPEVRVGWKGPVVPQDVPQTLRDYDLLLSPSRGENYGHVIAEALSVGTPVLISDQTPWRGLAWRGAGFDLPLNAPQAFVEALRHLASEDAEASARRRQAAHAYWQARSGRDDAIAAHRRMFNAVLRLPAR